MHRSCMAWSIVLLSACGATTQAPPRFPEVSSAPSEAPMHAVHKRGHNKLTAEVGPRGGTLELASGARLEIPEGALSQVVEVTFAEGARTTAFSNHEYEKAVGPPLQIAPELDLSAPVTVSMPLATLPEGFKESDLALGVEVSAGTQRLEMQGTQTRWDYLEAAANQGRATASLNGVPGYRVQFLVSRSN